MSAATVSRRRLETGQIAERVRHALDTPLPELPPAPRPLYTLARGRSPDNLSKVTLTT